jgi:hypothetical protein
MGTNIRHQPIGQLIDDASGVSYRRVLPTDDTTYWKNAVRSHVSARALSMLRAWL